MRDIGWAVLVIIARERERSERVVRQSELNMTN